MPKFTRKPETVEAVLYDGTIAAAEAIKALDPGNVDLPGMSDEERTIEGAWPYRPVQVRIAPDASWQFLPAGCYAVKRGDGVIPIHKDRFEAEYRASTAKS